MSGNGVRTAPPAVVFRFANFQLAPARELLLEGDKPVRIGSRALRILTALVERAGQLVGKNELIDIVWPDTFVEDANLKVHISALRRILGDTEGRLIANVPGRGYRFVSDVMRSEASETQPVLASRAPGTVPALLTKVIGRESAVTSIAALLEQHRFVTVVGAAGIGKTTVAIAVTDRVAPLLKDNACFVELSAVPDPALLPSVIASALGLRSAAADPLAKAVELIAGKEMLLVLDNCEHLIERVADIAETLLRNAVSLRILATSREPLRAQGEHIHRLATLSFPPEDAIPSAKGALDHSAVALFVERARANAETFAFEDADVKAVVEICRQLDGLPLALEFAAARLQDFGLQGLAKRLADRLSVLNKGLRTAVPRQKTLRAALDWSFELLTQGEQVLLARLGVFAGPFTPQVVKAVCSPAQQGDATLLEDLSALVEKSMLVVDTSEDPVRYHLLETTKEYALEKLGALDEIDALAARKASTMRDLFASAKQRWTLETSRGWMREHRHWIGDVRAGLDWTFGNDRDVELGASLVLEASQLWIDLGLLPEFFERALHALNGLAADDKHDKRVEMRLSSAIGHAIYELGARPDLKPAMVKAFEGALALAKELGDADHEVRALVGRCISHVALGEYAEVLPLAERFREVGRKLPRSDIDLFYNRASGVARVLMGDLHEADRHTKAALRDPAIKARADVHEGFDFDPLIFTRNIQTRLLWMRGFPDQALAVARENLEDALSLGHLPSYINALQMTAMTVPLWYGDPSFLSGPLERYVSYGEERLDYRRLWRVVIRLAVDSRAEGWNYRQARQTLVDLNTTFNNYGDELMASYHAGFVMPHMLGRVREGRSGWCAPEIIRAHGEERLNEGDLVAADEAFNESLELARRQGSLASELTSAMSLVRLDLSRGSSGPGRDLLWSVYERYKEGFASTDLRAARALLQQD